MSGARWKRLSDGTFVGDAEALLPSGALRPGYGFPGSTLKPGDRVTFDISMMDAASAASFLTDAAGRPRRFVDADTGAPVAMNAEIVAAMVAEAARLNLSLDRYVKEVLRYASAEQVLSGEPA